MSWRFRGKFAASVLRMSKDGSFVCSAKHNGCTSKSSARAGFEGFAALVLFALAILLAGPAHADDLLPPAPYAYRQLDDPRLEAKAQALMETLRCLQCQSQSIADSDAPMAGDMRDAVRSRILAGEEPEAIRSWLVERYGDYVTYTPQLKPITWPLFAAPLVILALAAVLLRKRFRRAVKAGGEA